MKKPSKKKNYKRASNYRQIYFRHHDGPRYRCVYCGRKLKADAVEVDHLVSVAAAQKKFYARWLLFFQGVTNVNDPHNLVASCMRCNRKKSSKMGFWIIKGTLGQYEIYWILRAVLTIMMILGIIWFVHEVTDLNYIRDAFNEIVRFFKILSETCKQYYNTTL